MLVGQQACRACSGFLVIKYDNAVVSLKQFTAFFSYFMGSPSNPLALGLITLVIYSINLVGSSGVDNSAG